MRKLLAAMFAGIALYSAASSFRLAQQDFLYTSVATEVSFWGRGDYEPTAFTTELAVRGVERLIQQAPANSKYLSLQAKLYSWQGYWAQDTSTKSEFGQMAVASPMIQADMIEAQEFPQLSMKYQVMGVPRTVINDVAHLEGAAPEPMVMDKLREALNNHNAK